jgi:iron complex outermembrane receptor protein
MATASRSGPQRWSALASAVSTILAGAAFPAFAQQQDEAEDLDEIVVTGSRIVRRDFEAASPIMTVGQEQFQNISTVGVEAALNQLPQFVPGGGNGGPGSGTQFGTGDVQSTASNSPGISVLNLRGLGPNRNLVLINGRRAQPANAALLIDVNTIPAAAIESVEVITGGASAVYGADAIGGVVNFKLRDTFEGISFDLQSSGTDQGGGEETRFSALLGGNFSDGRGNAMVGMEWAKREEIRSVERDFFREGFLDPGTTGGFGGLTTYSRFDTGFPYFPSQAAIDQVMAGLAPAGSIGPDTDFHFNADGSAFIMQGGLGYNGPIAPQTLQYKRQSNGNLTGNFIEGLVSSPLERYSVFARSTYEVTDNMQAFVQGNFTSVDVDQVLAYSPSTQFWGASIPNDGRAVPAELQTLLDSRADFDPDGPGPAPLLIGRDQPWTLTRDTDFLGPRTSDNRNRMFQIMTGVEGDIGETEWTYEAYFSHGETTVKNGLGGFASTARFTDIVEAPNWGAGWIGGDFVQGFLGFQNSCTTGFPIFANFKPSQDCIDAVSLNMTNNTEMEQNVWEANFQGLIAELPKGELRAAVGVSKRENTVQFTPDQFIDRENLVDVPIGLFGANDTGGSTDVKEIYGELLVPITGKFNLELGVRSSDYNSSDRLETYKALFDYNVTESIRLRGGRQVANRAPNTAELFAGKQQQVVGLTYSDVCAVSTIAPWGNVPGNPNRGRVQALCSALINAPPGVPSSFDLNPNTYDTFFGFFPLELDSNEGNPNVQSEKAETYTLGVIWGGDNLNVSVDWYDVEIKDAIGSPTADTIYEQCFNANGASNPGYSINDPGGYCRMMVRDPVSGGRLLVNTMPINVGGIRTSGVDVQVNWNKPFGPGALLTNVVVNYLDKYESQDTNSSPFLDAKGTLDEGGQFDYRIFANLTYAADEWSAGARLRYLPSAKDQSAVRNPNTAILGVDSYQLVDVFGSYRVRDSISLRAGIDNLFDPDPEIVAEFPGTNNNRGNTLPGFYDILGRRYWVGVSFSF